MGFMDLTGRIMTLEVGFYELARRIDEVPKRVVLSAGRILPGCTSVGEFDPDLIEAQREFKSGGIRASSSPIL